MLRNEIKARMTLKGYTQEYMAKELGMAKNTFNKIVNFAGIGLDDAKKIAILLDIEDPEDIKRIFFS